MTDENDIPTPEPDNTIEDVDRQQCGCTVTTFESGRKIFAPCPPCGLFQTAGQLQDAAVSMRGFRGLFRRRQTADHIQRGAMALAAVATTLQQEQIKAIRQAALVDAIKKAQEDTARAEDEAAQAKNGKVIDGPGSDRKGTMPL